MSRHPAGTLKVAKWCLWVRFDHSSESRSGPFRNYQTVSPRSTLAIWPYDTPHKVGILRRPLGLFAGRSSTATRKKSPRKQGSCWQPPSKRSGLKGAKSPITMVGRG
jgi:hypothetical protein